MPRSHKRNKNKENVNIQILYQTDITQIFIYASEYFFL